MFYIQSTNISDFPLAFSLFFISNINILGDEQKLEEETDIDRLQNTSRHQEYVCSSFYHTPKIRTYAVKQVFLCVLMYCMTLCLPAFDKSQLWVYLCCLLIYCLRLFLLFRNILCGVVDIVLHIMCTNFMVTGANIN